MIRARILTAAFLAASTMLTGAGFEFGTRLQSQWPGITFVGTTTFRGPDGTEDIRIARKTFLARRENILYLDFEEENPAFLRDSAGNYRLQSTEYIFSRDAKMGRGSAVFQHPNHVVLVASPDELWPGTKPLADFTIEGWVKPAHFRPDSTIIRKVGLLEGKKRGFELMLDGPYLTAVFWDLFTDADEMRHTVRLRGTTPIPIGKWTHVALAYQARSGKIVLIRDGREEDVKIASSRSNLWHAAFSERDRSPIEIGRQFFGALDDIRIVRGFPSSPDDVDHTPFEKNSQPVTAASDVLFTGRTEAARFRSDVLEPAGTSVA
ncbi:MAG: LamG domain-containing protein, partial [Spirochaetia bacterium]|nr:LamG domain-containing protein [Spirochaetia bacterium]